MSFYRKKEQNIEEEKVEEVLPKVSGEKFYEVDPSFHAMLASKKQKQKTETVESEEEMEEPKSTNEKPFSLLSMFGKVEKSIEEGLKGKEYVL